ncbi:MAG: hypothetical protein RLZZ450_3464 [Pseudomonadota bacterium]|jgi:hypothetical protein
MRDKSEGLVARQAWVFVGLFALLVACGDTPASAPGAEASDPADTDDDSAGPTSRDAGRVVDGGGTSPSAPGRDAGAGNGGTPTASRATWQVRRRGWSAVEHPVRAWTASTCTAS